MLFLIQLLYMMMIDINQKIKNGMNEMRVNDSDSEMRMRRNNELANWSIPEMQSVYRWIP